MANPQHPVRGQKSSMADKTLLLDGRISSMSRCTPQMLGLTSLSHRTLLRSGRKTLQLAESGSLLKD